MVAYPALLETTLHAPRHHTTKAGRDLDAVAIEGGALCSQ